MKIQLFEGRILKPFDKVNLSGDFELEPFKKKRTNPQNKYIHGYLFTESAKIMTQQLKIKISPKMAKYILKARCAVDYVEKLDEWIQIDTRDMNTVRMGRFIEDCLRYMAKKYSVALLAPNEIDYSEINI